MSLTMYRGRTQSLFRFLPQQPYNWQGREGSFIGLDDVDAADMDVPSDWLRHALRRRIRPFVEAARRSGIDLPGMGIIEGGQFDLLEPRRLRGELFPRTYVCLECDRFHSDPRDTRRCRDCNGRLVQWSFVEFHRCGHIAGLSTPGCRNGCRAAMKLVNRESRNLSEWAWQCSRCGTRADRGVYRACPQCRHGQARILRADASPVFYPQHVSVVNPPRREDYAILEPGTVYRAAVAQALGRLPAGLDGLRDATNDAGSDDAMDDTRQRLVRDFGLEEDDPMLEQLLQKRKEQLTRDEGWEATVDSLNLDPEVIEELGFQCVELTLAREASAVTIADLVEQAPSASIRTMYETSYRDTLGRFGFVEATLLRKFPLAYIVAGFTRESREPEDGVIFSFFRGQGGRLAMFGQRTETEAILFRIDPVRVVRWLVASGLVDDPGDVDPQAWLFSVLEPVDSIFDPPDHAITRAVLGLVHSVSHRTLRAVALRSGLAEQSLSEYLLPHNLGFLIYADTRSEFVLGGLEHVYRNHLADSLASMDEERRCVFDPPCRNHSGACAICMHLSENSCERFNSALSRWYLFGGNDEATTWQPFWPR